MKKLNMFVKSIFGLLFLTIVLILGCLNSNEPSQRIQPTDEAKVINLHAQQLILNESEIKEVLGSSWENVKSNEISASSDNGITVGDGVSVV